jgi:tetratricopeptide (TPR) repeat protein
MSRTTNTILLTLLLSTAPLLAQGPQALNMDVLQFDGKSGYVELPQNIFDQLPQATIEAWVKWERFGKYSRVFDFGREKNSVALQNEKTSSNIIFAIFDRNGKRHRIREKKVLSQGAWHHIAAVCGPGGMELYIDGRQFNDKGIFSGGYDGGPNIASGGRNYIGKSNWPKDKLFQGHIVEFRVWDRRLTAQEIESRKNRLLTGKEPGLYAYFPLNEFQGTSLANLGTSGHAGNLVGDIKLTSVPAISRFLVPGELGKEADIHYQAAVEAFEIQDYRTAESKFREAVTFWADHKDAAVRAEESKRLGDEAAALEHYTQALADMEQEAHIPAYENFVEAIYYVEDYKDTRERMAIALEKASYNVGVFLFGPIRLREAPPVPTGEKEGNVSRFFKWLAEGNKDDLLGKPDEIKRVRNGLYSALLDDLNNTKPDYVRLLDQTRLVETVSPQGAFADSFSVSQVLTASKAAGVPVVIIGEMSVARLATKSKKKKKEAFTVKKVKYKDDKGKNKTREESKKKYTYYIQEKSISMECAMDYRIMDTATGEVLGGGNLSVTDGDEIEFVNWNRYDGVKPRDLRKKSGTRFNKLSNDHKELFEARSKLKEKWPMLNQAGNQMAGQLSGRILTALDGYTPPKGEGKAGE